MGSKQLGKDARIAVPIGVGEGGALRRLDAHMMEPRLMARHHGFDFAQRRSAAELGDNSARN
jgi:hypothetical protein